MPNLSFGTDCKKHRQQREPCCHQSQLQVVAERVFFSCIGGEDPPELKIAQHDDRRGDGKAQRELTDELGTAQLGQHHQHPPLATGVHQVAGERPRKVRPEREPAPERRGPGIGHGVMNHHGRRVSVALNMNWL